MTEEQGTRSRVEVYSMMQGDCGVTVYRDLQEGVFEVTDSNSGDELATYSFNMAARNSLTRRQAENFAKEYADGYVAGYVDCQEDD